MNGHQLTPNSDRPGTANGIDHQRDRPVVAKRTCPPKPCGGQVFVARKKSFTPKWTKSTIEEPMEVIRWLDYR
jgi:hypothetical protein